MGLKTVINEFKRNVAVILISILIFITSPILTLFFGSLWLIRLLLTLWKRLFYPELGPLLQGVDSALHKGSPYSELQLLNIGQFTTVGGRIDLEEFRTVVKKGLENLRQSNESGQRLFQLLRTWAGFSVFENEREFQIQDHVTLLDVNDLNRRTERQCKIKHGIENVQTPLNKKLHVEHLTQSDLSKLNFALLKVPYKTDTSPWEMLLLYNPTSESESEGNKAEKSKPNKKWTTVIFLRINHSVSDGVAIAFIMSHFLDQSREFAYGRTMEFFSNEYDRKSHKWKQSAFTSVVSSLYGLVLGVPEFISHVILCSEGDWPPGIGTHDHTAPREYHVFSFQLPKDKLKSIQKSAGGVKITTVIYAAFVLGISEYFNPKKHNIRKIESSLPPHIYTCNIFGEPRRKPELQNKLSGIGVKLPIPSATRCTETDVRAVLNEIEKSYLTIKDSRIRSVANFVAALSGMLPSKLKPPLEPMGKVLVMSYVPWFEKPVTILGQPVLSTFGSANAPYEPCFAVNILEHLGTLSGNFCVGKEVLESHEEAQLLAKCFEKQFDIMYQQLTLS